VFKIASMWMDQNTISKIHFADQSEIYKCVPRSSLPKGVGGDVPDLPPLVDVWPQDKANTGGWFSWFRSSTSSVGCVRCHEAIVSARARARVCVCVCVCVCVYVRVGLRC
jgi:hypothetical protein